MDKVLAIIPARGGSKGIQGKNIRLLAGKPLLVYSIETAKNASCVTDVVVSTDDAKIAAIAKSYGAEVLMRPPELAGDDSIVMDAVRHLLKIEKVQGRFYDIVVLLEPTAPFRKSEYVDTAVDVIRSKGFDSVASYSESPTPLTRLWRIDKHNAKPFLENTDPFKPRQQQEKGYVLNGLVYAVKTSILEKYPDSRSWLLGKNYALIIQQEWSIDIDKESDFKLAELIMEKQI